MLAASRAFRIAQLFLVMISSHFTNSSVVSTRASRKLNSSQSIRIVDDSHAIGIDSNLGYLGSYAARTKIDHIDHSGRVGRGYRQRIIAAGYNRVATLGR